ncbi:N-terminal domain of NEFA-interacting nuclear protein NIP30-domain-containing protein [Pyrenochaeta sp. MPI-SDFR-AT-0127]|nr:N-terminal domain of NEFA-interacting nuclear protein NIP30-domain-containing protein [Pyrenochaeta sp. MPI-SDFR-AT-0127]
MSSGFVSGGTAGQETERDAEWKAAAQQLEDARREKEKLAEQHDGKSLYEVLQANKDKKQAEFEEKARFKLHNALDDDEADYLESVLEKQRKEEANVRKETSEQLDLFRRQQEEAERMVLEEETTKLPTGDGGQWAVTGRKRKKGPEASLLKGVKLRKSSSVAEDEKALKKAKGENQSTQSAAVEDPAVITLQATTKSPVPPVTRPLASMPATASPLGKQPDLLTLGLGYASSDDED